MFTKKFNENQLPLLNKKYIDPTECAFNECGKQINLTNSKKDPDSGKFMCDEHFHTCYNCEYEFINLILAADKNKYCKSCIGKFFKHCPNCNALVNVDDLLPPTKRNINYMKNGGCIECCETCSNCYKVVNDNDLIKRYGVNYCQDCENHTICDICNEYKPNDSIFNCENDNVQICADCFYDKYTTCEHCESITEINKDLTIENKQYCEKCYDNIFIINNSSEEEILDAIDKHHDLIKYIDNPSPKIIAKSIPYIHSKWERDKLLQNPRFCNLITNRKITKYINPFTNKPLEMGTKGPILEENPMLSPNPYTGKKPLIPLEKYRTKEIILPDFWEPKPLEEQPEGSELIWQTLAKKPWLYSPKIIQVHPGEECYYLNEYELKDNEVFDEVAYDRHEDEEGNVTYTPNPQGLTWRDKAYPKNINSNIIYKLIKKYASYKTYKLAKKFFLKYALVN